MLYSEVIRALCSVLSFDEKTLTKVLLLGGKTLEPSIVSRLFVKCDQPEDFPGSSDLLRSFLEGLIIYKRGPSDHKQTVDHADLTNNMILKKIRIAFEIKEKDITEILSGVGRPLSKYELSAIFRKPGHRNYKACSDELLGDFLKGLLLRKDELTSKNA